MNECGRDQRCRTQSSPSHLQVSRNVLALLLVPVLLLSSHLKVSSALSENNEEKSAAAVMHPAVRLQYLLSACQKVSPRPRSLWSPVTYPTALCRYQAESPSAGTGIKRVRCSSSPEFRKPSSELAGAAGGSAGYSRSTLWMFLLNWRTSFCKPNFP